MKKYKALTFLAILLVSFSSIIFSVEKQDYVKLADKHIAQFGKEMRTSYNLQLAGSGGAMMQDIKIFNFFFETEKSCDLINAQSLAINMIEKFLNQVNSDPKIRIFLHDYPITGKNVYIGVNIINKSTTSSSIDLISIKDGVVRLYNKNSKEALFRKPYQDIKRDLHL